MTTENTQLPVIQNKAPEAMVVAQKVNALAKLFQLKPKTLELVSKSTTKDGAIPGTFRVTSTNESFKEMRAVVLFEPIEQREMYSKTAGYNKDAKTCFSLDNVQPHAKAKNPPAMYCASCPMGDINWEKYRKAKAQGITGPELAAYLPPCRKFWHLFIASRETQRPYYFNVKGGSVKPFEDAMQNMADLFQMMIQNIKAENKVISAANKALQDAAKPGEAVELKALKPMPDSIGDLIWQISFTLYSWQRNGGPFMVGMKDFKVMTKEDSADFGKIIEDIRVRREAGQVQSQEASEAEEESAAVSEAPSQARAIPTAQAEVIQQNSQIQI